MFSVLKVAAASMAGLALLITAGCSVSAAQNVTAVQNGAALFQKNCSYCHSTDPEKHMIGPSLSGVVDRQSGTAPGYIYSKAMKESEITWSEGKLMKYLSDPKALILCHASRINGQFKCDDIKMSFRGFDRIEDARAVVEFLKTK